jgi:hypothetical protein
LPEVNLDSAITDLTNGLEAMVFQDRDFRNSNFMRLNTLKHLKNAGYLNEDLEWVRHRRKLVEA